MKWGVFLLVVVLIPFAFADANSTPNCSVINLGGDAFLFRSGNDFLELREPIGEVYDTLTDSEFEGLGGGTITTTLGTTDYTQYMRFGDALGTPLQRIAVNFVENEDDVVGDFLVIENDAPFFEWEFEASFGVESQVNEGNLLDLQGESIYIMGVTAYVLNATIDQDGSVSILFATGEVEDAMREGETRIYEINQVAREVTLVSVSDPGQNETPSARFSLNGELSTPLVGGETYVFTDGTGLRVNDLLINAQEGVASFFLGAHTIEFIDPRTNYGTYDGTFLYGGEPIEEADVSIVGQFTSPDNSTFILINIKYRLTADAGTGSAIYIPPGHGVREFLDDPRGLLSSMFNLRYEGLRAVNTTHARITPSQDGGYVFSAMNVRSAAYSTPFVTNQGDIFKYGDVEHAFWFVESAPSEANHSPENLRIRQGDYVALSENAIESATATDDSAIIRYDGIDTSAMILTFTDTATDDPLQVSYDATSEHGPHVGGFTSNLVVDGVQHTVLISNDEEPRLSIDLDGDGDIAGDEVGFTLLGGGVFDYSDTPPAGNESIIGSGAPGTSITVALRTPSSQFDDLSLGGDTLTWTITSAIGGSFTSSTPSYSGPLAQPSNSPWGHFEMALNTTEQDVGITDFGARIDHAHPDAGMPSIDITYPENQVQTYVFGIMGEISITHVNQCPPSPPVCGNGIAEEGETCSTCPADAGACPAPPAPTNTGGGGGGRGGGYIPPRVNVTNETTAEVEDEQAEQVEDVSGTSTEGTNVEATPVEEVDESVVTPQVDNAITGAVIGEGQGAWIWFAIAAWTVLTLLSFARFLRKK